MRKEILFAILAGGVFGLVIAFGVWRINSSLSPKDENKTETTTTNDQSTPEIAIAEPSENDVITSGPVKVSGVTKPGAFVVISAQEEDYLSLADDKGPFTEEVELVGGVNQIVVTSFGTDNTKAEQKLTLIYSTEFAKLMSTPSPTPSEEVSTDSIRLKVQEKVNEALNSPTGYIGTITDISGTTIQLKSASSGEIEQVSTEDSPAVVQDGKSPKEVKLTDLAIGDFIIAMGYRNGNHVLYAKRILITSPIATTERKSVMGKIADITSKSIDISTTSTSETLSATPISGASIYELRENKLTSIKFSSLKEGNFVIVSGEGSNDKFEPRTIFLIDTP